MTICLKNDIRFKDVIIEVVKADFKRDVNFKMTH